MTYETFHRKYENSVPYYKKVRRSFPDFLLEKNIGNPSALRNLSFVKMAALKYYKFSKYESLETCI